MILNYDVFDERDCVCKFLFQRLRLLGSNIGKYILLITRNVGENFHFDLANVVSVVFLEDGFEVILDDGSTAYVFVCDVIGFDLVYKGTMEK